MSDSGPQHDPPPYPSSAPPPPPPGATAPPPASPASGPASPAGPVTIARVTGLATALRALFWVAAAVSVLPVLAAVNRRSAWNDFVDGSGSLRDLDSADDALGSAVLLLGLLQLAVVIVLCVWSIRAARNANNLWRAGTSPGLAGGGWFIPVANLIVPFVQLRRAVRAAGLAATAVSTWQAVLIVQVVANVIGQRVGNLNRVDRFDDVSGQLGAQIWLFLLGAAFTATAAFFASRTVMQLSQAEDASAGAVR